MVGMVTKFSELLAVEDATASGTSSGGCDEKKKKVPNWLQIILGWPHRSEKE